MPLTWIYRKRGGEVRGLSVIGAEAYANINPTYFGTVDDPPTPDGATLAPKKVWDGTSIRNATPQEVAAFAAADVEDENLMARDRARDMLDGTNVASRKVLRSIVEVLVEELNVLRAAVVPPLPPRTLNQAKTAIINKIDSGTND